jgi:hypothetical protein
MKTLMGPARISARWVILLGLMALSVLETLSQPSQHKQVAAGQLIDYLYEPRMVRFRHDSLKVYPRWFVPDHLKVQYAGNIGFASVGAGYHVRGRYEPSLFVGLLNYSFGGSAHTVTTLSFKNSFKLSKRPLMGGFYPKAGLSVNWGYTHNTFNKLPPHYAAKYYFQNKVHLAPFAGGEWLFRLRDRHLNGIGLYFEFATLDAYLLEFLRTGYVDFDDIWNLALGVSFYIR